MAQMSLQRFFDILHRSLGSALDDYQAHYDVVAAAGVDATEQKRYSENTNNLLLTVREAQNYSGLTEWWRGAAPSAPAYDVQADLLVLEVDLQDFNLTVARGTPTDEGNGYINDTRLLVDGIRSDQLPDPYTGPCIITYDPRQYTAGQASAQYLPALQNIINTLTTILEA